MCKCFFLHIVIFLFWRWVFSRALDAGARKESARTSRRKCGPCPRSVARDLGAQSPENRQVTTGRHSEHVEPSQPMQTHVPGTIQVRKISVCACRSEFCWRLALTACPPRARPHVLVLVLECTSCSSSSAHARALVLVLECCRARTRARVLIFRRVGKDKYMYS